MKKFILKSCVFLLLLAIVIGICNWGYLRTDPLSVDKFKQVPDQIEICNLGASHSLCSFNFSDYSDLTTFNFGLVTQSHQYDYIILNHYKNKIKRGAVIFLVVSYPMIAGHDEIERVDHFRMLNDRYYTFLSANEIRCYDFVTDLEMKIVPFIRAATIRSLIANVFAGKKSEHWLWQTIEEEAARDAADQAAKDHLGDGSRDENGNLLLNQGAIESIYKIVDLCKTIDVNLILLTPPFTEAYLTEIKNIAPEYYEHGFSDCIHKIQEETGVSYYDYSRDERFMTNYSLFMNSDHLNMEGARQFTDIVMEEVVKVERNAAA